MKKEILKLFTCENGIVLSKNVMDRLVECIKDREDLESFYAHFKEKFNTSSLELEQIDQLLSKSYDKLDSYIIKNTKYTEMDFYSKYDLFRSKIMWKITPISLLEDEDGVIFGILYRNKTGKFILEDDHESIIVNFDDVKNDGFVFENMFVGLSGCKIIDNNNDSFFCVYEIILPDIQVNKSKNNFLKKNNSKICIFGGVENTLFIKNVIERENPDFSVVSTHLKLNFENLGTVLVTSSKKDESLLPSKMQNISNPFILELFDSKIGFIDCELFKERSKGVFFNKNPLESFLKSILSQNNLNPFCSSDLYISEFPNIFIISQSTYPQVIDIDSVKIVSLPDDNKSYAVLDFNNNRFEVVCENINV